VLFTVAASIIMLSAVVSVASAGRRSVSSQTFRWAIARWDISGGFGTTECPVTLEGSYHSRTFAKVIGALIGYVTRAVLGVCPRGSATVLLPTLPIHARYAGFGGTLPNYSWWDKLLNFLGLEVKEPTFGVTCLLSGGTLRARENREASGALTSVELTGRSPSSCGIEGTVSGTGAVTVAGSAARITITLI
jgi:hypothetical protein